MRDEAGLLTTQIYRKPTHTDRFLNYNSEHSVGQKRGLVKTLLHRANSNLISNENDRSNEKKKVLNALKLNDYPAWFLKQASSENQKQSELVSDGIKGISILPYVKGYTENISRILKGVGVKVCTKPCRTIRSILPTPKDGIEPHKRCGAIYAIPCSDCPQIYIGETKRSFSTRQKEHARQLNRKSLNKIDDNNWNKQTALVRHMVSNDHVTDWSNCKILQFENDYRKRRFLESFHINKNLHAMNDKTNCFYSEIYQSLK